MSLPYLHVPTLHLFTFPDALPLLGGKPLDIQPFGILVASGVLLASWMGRRYCERNGLDEETWRRLSVSLLVVGFIACHLLDILFYDRPRLLGLPPYSKPDWLLLFRIWDGISSWGGVVGGTGAFLWFAKKHKIDKLVWADVMAYAAIGGWLLGRAACAVAHDHTGGPTDFVLGVAVPSPAPEHMPKLVARYAGQTIHDLGLYEFLFLIPILVVIVLVARIPDRKPGLLMGLLATLYSVPRFFIDFLRLEESDPRYFGLTFAQYCCIVAFVFGLTLLFRKRRPTVEAGAAGEARAAEGRRPGGVRPRR